MDSSCDDNQKVKNENVLWNGFGSFKMAKNSLFTKKFEEFEKTTSESRTSK